VIVSAPLPFAAAVSSNPASCVLLVTLNSRLFEETGLIVTSPAQSNRRVPIWGVVVRNTVRAAGAVSLKSAHLSCVAGTGPDHFVPSDQLPPDAEFHFDGLKALSSQPAYWLMRTASIRSPVLLGWLPLNHD
jgi:hypothetical protein